jgi:NAD(P)-dependent dehydrogenase (short-subunit alcohol dehydrogenase family)
MSNQARVAIVTGAAQGMGRAFSKRLARDGVHVIAVDLQESTETVNQVREAGGSAEARVVDITDQAAVGELVDALHQEHGGVDILVNNAALHGNPLTRIVDMDFATWKRIMSVNLDAPFMMTQAVLPGMITKRWGRIINMSSSSLSSMAPGGMTHYIASKGGIVGFTRGLANEVGEFGITVNAIAPHGVNSPGAAAFEGAEEINKMVVAGQAIKRLTEPEEVAGTVGFLASDEASMVTAQVIHVDAGVVRAG